MSTRLLKRHDRNETTALLRFSELVGEELGHQAKTYSDPRAERPREQVAEAGRRLRRRRAVLDTTTVLALIFLAMVWFFAVRPVLFG